LVETHVLEDRIFLVILMLDNRIIKKKKENINISFSVKKIDFSKKEHLFRAVITIIIKRTIENCQYFMYVEYFLRISFLI